MEFKEIVDREWWDKTVVSFEDYTFLQGWDWGEINKVAGGGVWRVGIFDKEELVGIMSAFIISAKRGKILFVPHGPLLKKNDTKTWLEIIGYLKKIAQDNGVVCVRISPWLARTEENEVLFKSLGMVKAGVIMHAEDTWLVDLRGTEEEVLSRMRKTTRNLVRRAMREEVVIEKSVNLEDVEYLYNLQLEVVKRNNFVPFTKEYLKKELKQFFESGKGVLFLGKSGGEVLGAALIVFMGKFAFYYQSGSKESRVPVNYLLQWEVIREARARGGEMYNMWGIAPEGVPNHPWNGLTLFKTGFGGECKKYMRSWDLPTNRRYHLMRLVERIPKTWRQRLAGRRV